MEVMGTQERLRNVRRMSNNPELLADSFYFYTEGSGNIVYLRKACKLDFVSINLIVIENGTTYLTFIQI